jgi:1,4-alpha-glucan branching enzyme
MRNFNVELRSLIESNPVLKSGCIASTYNDNNHNVHIHQLKLGADEVLVIKNYGHGFHDKNYEYYGFPQNSQWKEIFSSDEKFYGGSGYNNKREEPITNVNQNLSLAPYSFIILKKVS